MNRKRRGRRAQFEDHAPRRVSSPDMSMRSLRAVPLSALTPGTVVRARIDFSDGTGWKTRPAVVASASGRDVIVHPVTSGQSRVAGLRLDLQEWDVAGLTRPCAVLARLVTVDRGTDIVEVIGELSEADRDAVAEMPSVTVGA